MNFTSRHLLGLDGLPAEDIVTILDTTKSFREVLDRPIKRLPTLQGKTIVNLFYENSTRTRISFELAEKTPVRGYRQFFHINQLHQKGRNAD